MLGLSIQVIVTSYFVVLQKLIWIATDSSSTWTMNRRLKHKNPKSHRKVSLSNKNPPAQKPPSPTSRDAKHSLKTQPCDTEPQTLHPALDPKLEASSAFRVQGLGLGFRVSDECRNLIKKPRAYNPKIEGFI